MRFELRLRFVFRQILRLVSVDDKSMQSDDPDRNRVMAVTLLKFPERCGIKTVERSLQRENVVTCPLIVCGTLVSCRHLKGLFLSLLTNASTSSSHVSSDISMPSSFNKRLSAILSATH
jgi:hypothetical protein